MAMALRLTVVTALLAVSARALAPPQSAATRITPLASSTSSSDEAAAAGTSTALVSAKDEKSKLASAFAALNENDQYDAVLTGLCAKILDEGADDAAVEALKDPINLMQEMNLRRVTASGRSLMSLIDATVVSQDAKSMAEIMSLCSQNGGVTQYGTLQSTLTPLPTSPLSTVQCPDGSTKTRAERLESVMDIPKDDRGSEVTAALAFSSYAAVCGFANFFGMDDITPYTNTILFAVTLFGVVDNFYDVLKLGADVAAKDNDNKQAMPDKGSLPLGLGTGKITGTVFRGLTRLTTVDTERDCECEAAAFFAAYVYGLPCFAFRPNALESAVMAVESIKKDSGLDPLLSSVGILKMLVWLLAPVAMESSKHAQLVMSDPRESGGLLERLEDKADLLKDGDLFWASNEDEKNDLLKWAYTEADLLLRENAGVVKEVSQRLAGGAATVGDCVAAIENW